MFGSSVERLESLIAKSGTVSVGDRNLARYMVYSSVEHSQTGLIFFGVRHSRSELGEAVRWSHLRSLLRLVADDHSHMAAGRNIDSVNPELRRPQIHHSALESSHR